MLFVSIADNYDNEPVHKPTECDPDGERPREYVVQPYFVLYEDCRWWEDVKLRS